MFVLKYNISFNLIFFMVLLLVIRSKDKTIMKKKILTFCTIFLIAFTTLNGFVLGFTSYDEYYNTKYLYSIKVPKDIKNVLMENNQSSVIIPYEDQIRLEIKVEDVDDLITDDDIDKYDIRDTDKLDLKSDVFENTYASESYLKENGDKIVKQFAPSPSVTSVESFKMDRRNAFKIFYNTKITSADNKKMTGHGLVLFTIDQGNVYYFIFTDNSLEKSNITDYDFINKAISSINLEDFDYTPFILIGILCVILYILLMSLYLKAEKRAMERKERRLREKELKKKRALGIEPVSRDDEYEYYDEIVLEEADENEEVDGETVFTVEQIMKLYPSLKDIKIRPRGEDNKEEDLSFENNNLSEYKDIEKDIENKINNKNEESIELGSGVAAMSVVSGNEPDFFEISDSKDIESEVGFELVKNDDEPERSVYKVVNDEYNDDEDSFVFEDVDETLFEDKKDNNINLTFKQEGSGNDTGVDVNEFGNDIDEETSDDFGYDFKVNDIEKVENDEVVIDEEELFENILEHREDNFKEESDLESLSEKEEISQEDIEDIISEVAKMDETSEGVAGDEEYLKSKEDISSEDETKESLDIDSDESGVKENEKDGEEEYDEYAEALEFFDE